jgi:hypothetical protein
MSRKKKKKKHWREFISNNLLPAKYQLVQYEPLIKKITLVARGETQTPKDIYKRFIQSFRAKHKTNTPVILLKSSSKVIPSLSQEDLEQQCWLYLIELWDFYTYKWNKAGAATNRVFYDFIRINLSRWLGIYVATEINKHHSEQIGMPITESYEMELPETFKMDLGWVLLKTTDGIFSRLTTKQKYLLFLRYSKDLTIKEISSLVQQHRAKIEVEFSIINSIIFGEKNDPSRTDSKESK